MGAPFFPGWDWGGCWGRGWEEVVLVRSTRRPWMRLSVGTKVAFWKGSGHGWLCGVFFSDHKKTPVLRPIQNKVWGRFLPLYDSSAGKVKAFNQHYDYEGFVSGDCQICMAQFCSFTHLYIWNSHCSYLTINLKPLNNKTKQFWVRHFGKNMWLLFTQMLEMPGDWVDFTTKLSRSKFVGPKIFCPGEGALEPKEELAWAPWVWKRQFFSLGGILGAF